MSIDQHFRLGSRFYYQSLNAEEKCIYRKIYNELSIGKNTVAIFMPGNDFKTKSGMKVHDIVKYIINENPHIFHLETTQFSYTRVGANIIIKAQQIYSKDEYNAIYNRLYSIICTITAKVDLLQDEEHKLKYIHDYLAENIVYDYGASDPKSQREVHTIVGSVLNGACVCDGYARAFRLICDQANISNILVIGEAREKGEFCPHAWNIVKVGGEPYHVDITWDSCLSEGCKTVKDYFFLRSDYAFSPSHKWDRSFYPNCPNDHTNNAPTILNKYQLEEYVCKKIILGIDSFSIRFEHTYPNDEELKGLMENIMSRNADIFKKYHSYEFSYNRTMITFTYIEIKFLF